MQLQTSKDMNRHKRMCRKEHEVQKIGRREGKIKGWKKGIRHGQSQAREGSQEEKENEVINR